MDDYKGNVARLLKSIWISDGVVSSAAFNLRPQIHETYISVLRSEAESFSKITRRNFHHYQRTTIGRGRTI